MLCGELVIVSAQGDYGKPRPAVVIQNDRLLDQIDSVTVCFLTSEVIPTKNLRVTVEPDIVNGLHEQSQVQIEKIMTFPPLEGARTDREADHRANAGHRPLPDDLFRPLAAD